MATMKDLVERVVCTIIFAEEAARENYTVEGYRTDDTRLFKCRYCFKEAWGVLALSNKVQHTPSCILSVIEHAMVDGEAEYLSWDMEARPLVDTPSNDGDLWAILVQRAEKAVIRTPGESDFDVIQRAMRPPRPKANDGSPFSEYMS